MKDVLLLVIISGVLFGITVVFFNNLQKELRTATKMNKEILDYLDNFSIQQSDSIIEVKVENKLDISEIIEQIELELKEKLDIWKLRMEVSSDAILKDQLKNLPDSFKPNQAKFEEERKVDDKAPSFKILSDENDHILDDLRNLEIKHDKIHDVSNNSRNMLNKQALWYRRYLKENSIEQRIKDLNNVDLNKEIQTAKSSYDKSLKEIKDLLTNEKKLKEYSDKFDFSKNKNKADAINKAIEEKLAPFIKKNKNTKK